MARAVLHYCMERYRELWASPESAYRDEVYARQSKDGTKPLMDNPTIEEVERVLRSYEAQNILEVGCGWGRLSGPLIGKFRSVTGCDISTALLLRCPPGMGLFVYDIASPVGPFEPRYDVVFLRGVLNYIINDEKLMANARRNLALMAKKKVILWELPEVCKQFYGDPLYDCRPLEVKPE